MDELDDILDGVFARLARAPGDRDSPWRSPALATATPDGPGIRTIVLRSFDQAARVATLHTDARSAKMASLRGTAPAALHIWDSGRREQIRLDGTLSVAGAAETDAAWDALPSASRATYGMRLAPGTPVASPLDGLPHPDPGAARAVFTVLRLSVAVVEYLSLAPGGHRRAAFHWRDGRPAATWLVP